MVPKQVHRLAACNSDQRALTSPSLSGYHFQYKLNPQSLPSWVTGFQINEPAQEGTWPRRTAPAAAE